MIVIAKRESERGRKRVALVHGHVHRDFSLKIQMEYRAFAERTNRVAAIAGSLRKRMVNEEEGRWQCRTPKKGDEQEVAE